MQRAEHHVAGERGVDRHLGRLQVADFADQDHVRVVPQDRPQGVGEAEADLGVRLDLADARLVVLDRVLDGDDLGRLVLDLVERRVQRGGLAGAGRAGDEHDPVRPVDELLERAVDVREHPAGLEVERHAALVEQPHDDAFAVDHRDDRHADVDLTALHLHLDAAVLRQPLLGDVEPGHDLQPADDRGLEPVDLRRQVLQLQQAVDAVADLDPRLLDLDVDVRRPLVGRLDEDLVDEVDDRGLLGLLGHLGVVGLDVLEELDLVVLAGLGQGRDGVAADPEVGLDEPGDLAGRGEHRHDVQAGERLQLVEGVGVERVAGGDDERPVVPGDGHEVLAVDELLRHGREHVRGDDRVRQVDQLQAELLGEDRQEDVFPEEPLVDEDLVRGELGRGLDGLGGAGPVGVGEQPAGGERLEQLHSGTRGSA